MAGWRLSAPQHESFIGVSPGCETSRAEIVIPVTSEMGQLTGKPYHSSISLDVYSYCQGDNQLACCLSTTSKPHVEMSAIPSSRSGMTP